jgi:hypothetical protein
MSAALSETAHPPGAGLPAQPLGGAAHRLGRWSMTPRAPVLP